MTSRITRGWIVWDDAPTWSPTVDRPTRPTLRLTNVDRAELERLLFEGWPLAQAFAQVLIWRGLSPSKIEAAMVRRRIILPASGRELSIAELLRAWKLRAWKFSPKGDRMRRFGST